MQPSGVTTPGNRRLKSLLALGLRLLEQERFLARQRQVELPDRAADQAVHVLQQDLAERIKNVRNLRAVGPSWWAEARAIHVAVLLSCQLRRCPGAAPSRMADLRTQVPDAPRVFGARPAHLEHTLPSALSRRRSAWFGEFEDGRGNWWSTGRQTKAVEDFFYRIG